MPCAEDHSAKRCDGASYSFCPSFVLFGLPLKNTSKERPPPTLVGGSQNSHSQLEIGNPKLWFKETSQIPIPSTCLYKLLDPESQDHSGRDPFLALLMSKQCHSTREGATWTSLDQKPTPQAPQGNPEGGQAVVFPTGGNPIFPHTLCTNLG